MSDRKYVIVLRNETTDDNQQTTAANANGTGKTEKPKDQGTKVASKIGVAYTGLKSIIDPVASSYVNTVALRTGYEEKQQRMQFAYSIGKKTADTTMAIALGGSFAGAGGAALGALISAGSQLLNYAIRQNEIGYAQNNENTQIFLNQIRMGAGSSREGKTK